MRPLLALLLLVLATPVRGHDVGCLGTQPPAWLLAQDEAGAWDADTPQPDLPGFLPAGVDRDIEVTALAALTLLGSGELHGREGKHLARALGYLADRQRPDGGFPDVDLRSAALASFTLCEALRLGEGASDEVRAAWSEHLGGDSRLGQAATRAARNLEQRARWAGGWSRHGELCGALDPVTTLWAGLALVSARNSQLTEPERCLARARHALGVHVSSSDKDQLAGWLLRMVLGERPELGDYLADLRTRPEDLAADPELLLVASLVARLQGKTQTNAQDRITWHYLDRLKRFDKAWGYTRGSSSPTPERRAELEAQPMAFDEYFMSTLALLSYFRYAKLTGWD